MVNVNVMGQALSGLVSADSDRLFAQYLEIIRTTFKASISQRTFQPEWLAQLECIQQDFEEKAAAAEQSIQLHRSGSNRVSTAALNSLKMICKKKGWAVGIANLVAEYSKKAEAMVAGLLFILGACVEVASHSDKNAR